MAEMVMRSPASSDEETEASRAPDMPRYYVQRTAGGVGLDVSPKIEGSISRMQGGGQPLPTSERAFFENRFGHDFSKIRIHADGRAAETARSLSARAFTVGTDIAFDSGEYQPGTESGRHLLAHELTHTIQQTGGVATERVQRKAADEEGEQVTAPEEASAEQKSPVDLVAEAAQKLTDAEVLQQAVPPVEVQPLDLPEHKPQDAGGGGGGAAVAPAVAPAPNAEPQNAAKTPASPVPEQKAASSPPASAAQAAREALGSAPAPVPVAKTSSAAPTPEAKAPTPEINPAPKQKASAESANAAPEAEQTTLTEEADAEPAGRERPTSPEGAAPEAAAASPGAPEAEGDEDPDTDKRVQRMPAGRTIQRVLRSPEEDPAFQAVTANVKTTAVEQKQHAPARQKADEAAAAAKMPQEEKLGAAQNTQTTVIDQAAEAQKNVAAGGQAPGFDKAAFKASVKARIDELTPKDPKQMENIESSGVFGDVKSAVNEKVETGKDQAQGNVDDKVKEAPNPDAVPDKPVTGLQPNAPGQAPAQLDASGAAPKAKSPEEVETPLQQESQQLDTQMATAQITPEQLQNSNEPTFQSALQAKTSAQEHVQQVLPQYRATEQSQVQGVQTEVGALTQAGLGAMFNVRTDTFSQMDGLQNGAKGNDETKRAEIGRQIDGIFQRTKTDVEGILTALDTQVDQVFTSGADGAKRAAIDYIKRETEAYKAKRYNQDADWWRVDQHIAGAATHAWDAMTDMPAEYYEYYRQGRDLYVAEMDKVLDQVATIVGDHLDRAHQRVQQGREEIKKFVDCQPEELREVAQQAAQDAESKFGVLEQTITSKQQEIVDSLAQKYVEKLQTLDSELEQMKEAEKGLLAKAGDMINGVIKTIGELKDLLLSTLQRAAGAVMKILQNPIGFLGNLLSAVGQGLRQFVGNIGEHLKEGLISWLTGALTAGGIQLPTTWDLQGIFHLVMQLLGLTYGQIRAQIVKALGPIGETVIGALEQAWDVFQIIQSEGLAGLWTFVQGQVGDLQALVMDQIKEMVIGQVIKAGIDWLIGILGGPAGAFIKAVQAIVRVVTWFVDNAARVASFVNSVLDSVIAIANGDIAGAAGFIEQSLAKALPMVISFLADLLGLGGISKKVQEIIQKVRQPIQKGIDWLVQKAVALGKKLWGMLTGRSRREGTTSPNGGREQIGKVVQFQAAEENHRLWVDKQGSTATLMVASTPQPLEAQLAVWEGKLADLPHDKQAQVRGLLGQARRLLGSADQDADFLAKQQVGAKKPGVDGLMDQRQAELERGEEQLAGVLQQLFELLGDADGDTNWMQITEEFTSATNHKHTISFSSTGSEPELVMASSQPKSIELWIAQRRDPANPALTPEQEQSLREAEQTKTSIDGLTPRTKGPAKGTPPSNTTPLREQLSRLLQQLAAQLKAGDIDTEGLPLTRVTYQMNSSKPGSVLAEPLSKNPGNTTGSGPGNLPIPGWKHVERIQGEAWVRLHLLSEQLHGPGDYWNLVPARVALNNEVYRFVEERAIKEVQSNAVLFYNVDVKYHSGPTIDDFPSKITFTWGRMRMENGHYVQDKDREYQPFTIQPPPTVTVAEPDVYSLSTSSVRELTDPLGVNIAKKVVSVREAQENRVFVDLAHFQNAMREAYPIFDNKYWPVIDPLISNGRLVVTGPSQGSVVVADVGTPSLSRSPVRELIDVLGNRRLAENIVKVREEKKRQNNTGFIDEADFRDAMVEFYAGKTQNSDFQGTYWPDIKSKIDSGELDIT